MAWELIKECCPNVRMTIHAEVDRRSKPPFEFILDVETGCECCCSFGITVEYCPFCGTKLELKDGI